MKRKIKHIGTNSFHMEQNCATAIVGALLSGETHLRAIAKKLNTNHMLVSRRIRELISENVLDFYIKGKNKVYFLKKTIEAKNYVFISEFYKLNRFLKLYPVLRPIVERIQKHERIKLAIIFGSYARGMASPDSDIDIFIETKDRNLKKELEQLNSRLSVKIGSYTRSSPLIKEIEKNHIIIKGVELFYERSKFFE